MKLNQKGFTLVELMIVVVLMAFLMLAVIGLFLTLLRGQSETHALAKVKQEGDFATVALERVIRDGYNIECNDVAEEVTIFSERDGGLVDSKRIYFNLDKVVIDECVNRNDEVDCSTHPIDIHRELNSGGTGVTAANFAISCKDRLRFDHDAVMVEFELTDYDSGTMVPFRVIGTLRNVESR